MTNAELSSFAHTCNHLGKDFFTFHKGAQNIDKIFEITNWMIELTEDFSRRFHGWEGSNYGWKDDKVGWTDAGWQAWAIGPIGTRGGGMADPRRIGNEIKFHRDEWSKIAPDQRDAMMNLLLEDPTGVQQVRDESRLFIIDNAADGRRTELQRLPTPTMLERDADLKKLVDEAITAIIVGEKPLSAFDDMVTQLMNFFRELPRELEEAAIIDGASYWETLFHIYLPLSVPALATLTLFSAVTHWNSWFDGMVLITKNENYPIMTFLRTVVIDLNLQALSVNPEDLLNLSDRSIRAANIVVATLPILLVYPFLQRYFIHGIRLGSVKG